MKALLESVICLLLFLCLTMRMTRARTPGRSDDLWYLEQSLPWPPMPYSFGYEVRDHHGNEQYRKEMSDGNRVTGSYGYWGPDGIYRHVDYIADENGYRANIRTSEPGTANEDPASVRITSKPITIPPPPPPPFLPGTSLPGGSRTTPSLRDRERDRGSGEGEGSRGLGGGRGDGRRFSNENDRSGVNYDDSREMRGGVGGGRGGGRNDYDFKRRSDLQPGSRGTSLEGSRGSDEGSSGERDIYNPSRKGTTLPGSGRDDEDGDKSYNGDTDNGSVPQQGIGGKTGSDRGTDRGTDRGSDRGTNRGSDRGTDRGSDRGNDRGSDRGTDRGIDRGSNRGSDRGFDGGPNYEGTKGTKGGGGRRGPGAGGGRKGESEGGTGAVPIGGRDGVSIGVGIGVGRGKPPVKVFITDGPVQPSTKTVPSSKPKDVQPIRPIYGPDDVQSKGGSSGEREFGEREREPKAGPMSGTDMYGPDKSYGGARVPGDAGYKPGLYEVPAPPPDNREYPLPPTPQEPTRPGLRTNEERTDYPLPQPPTKSVPRAVAKPPIKSTSFEVGDQQTSQLKFDDDVDSAVDKYLQYRQNIYYHPLPVENYNYPQSQGYSDLYPKPMSYQYSHQVIHHMNEEPSKEELVEEKQDQIQQQYQTVSSFPDDNDLVRLSNSSRSEIEREDDANHYKASTLLVSPLPSPSPSPAPPAPTLPSSSTGTPSPPPTPTPTIHSSFLSLPSASPATVPSLSLKNEEDNSSSGHDEPDSRSSSHEWYGYYDQVDDQHVYGSSNESW